MFPKKNTFYAIIVALIATMGNTAFATILKNASMWNIKYKLGKPESKTYSERDEILLLPGDEIIFDLDKPISIRRSGRFSTMVSGWTQIPTPPGFIGTDDEVIEIGGLSATGWTFNAYKIR